MSALAGNLLGSDIDLFVSVMFTGIVWPAFPKREPFRRLNISAVSDFFCQPLRARSDLLTNCRRDKIVIQNKTNF